MDFGVGLFLASLGLIFIVFNKYIGDKAVEFQFMISGKKYDPVISRVAYLLFGLIFLFVGVAVILGWIHLKPRGA